VTATNTMLAPSVFVARLKDEGERRYHSHHPYHLRMHAGELSREQLQQWVLNRYYYQTRIPVKDALILAKSEDPIFRRRWIERIREQDGTEDGTGGLALWLRLAEGVGLDSKSVASCRQVLPGVRQACDRYVELVRRAPLVEAVAASLTECFAPDLMRARLDAWERHYPWVDKKALDYFRTRLSQARRDGEDALLFVVGHAVNRPQQERCIAALIRKTEVLTALLDALAAAYIDPPRAAAGAER
jgi:pyrroloquinoline-quinone synthase